MFCFAASKNSKFKLFRWAKVPFYKTQKIRLTIKIKICKWGRNVQVFERLHEYWDWNINTLICTLFSDTRWEEKRGRISMSKREGRPNVISIFSWKSFFAIAASPDGLMWRRRRRYIVSKVLNEVRDTHFGQLGVVQKVRPVTVNESAKCQPIPPAGKEKKKTENEIRDF